MKYKPIPFEDILTILVSIFLLLRDKKKKERVCILRVERKGNRSDRRCSWRHHIDLIQQGKMQGI